MKKSGNIFLVVSSLAVVGVLGYLLMRQLKATQKAKSEKKPIEDAEYKKYLELKKVTSVLSNPLMKFR